MNVTIAPGGELTIGPPESGPGDRIELRHEPLPQMPPELKALVQERK